MSTLSISYDLVTKFLAYLRVRVDLGAGEMNLLAVQGANPRADGSLELNANAVNEYNDTIIVANRTEVGASEAHAFLGTVDPGADPQYLNNPLGQAHLTFGQHLYVRGLHPAAGGRPALRAFKEINRVWRDPDKNFVPSPGEKVAIGSFGVNVHAGGTKLIGNWSAGCLNVAGGWDGAPWKKFMSLVETHFKKLPTVGVTVWTAKDLFRFAVEGPAMRPTLTFGMLNPWVEDLQRALAKKGYNVGKIDGDWQGGLDVIVRSFQQANGLKVDGAVGPVTWAKLLA